MASASSYVHVARSGETWDSIAYDAYLTERMADTVLKANPSLSGTVMFEGGEEVTVPVLDRARSYETLAPWRRP